jgi:hypothetical protein
MSGKSYKLRGSFEATLEIDECEVSLDRVKDDLDVQIGYDGIGATIVGHTYLVTDVEDEYDDDWAIPQELNVWGLQGARTIRGFLDKKGALFTGGCKVFYRPDEWKERGEDWGTEADLIVCHDGGAHAPYFNLDYCEYDKHNAMTDELEEYGLWAEQCTSWYTAIYHREAEDG